MLQIKKNVSLKSLNTFGVDVKARYCVHVTTTDELRKLIHTPIFKNNKVFVLGGGSNTLFTNDFTGLVIHVCIKEREFLQESDSFVVYRFGAGEIWDNVVEFCVNNGLGGLENLSGIPGTIGAAPIQNIGAYGVELKDVFDSLEATDLKTGEKRIFKGGDCEFGYRDSVFKSKLKGRYFVTNIVLRLTKTPRLNLQYKGITDKLATMGVADPSIKDIRKAVLEIRKEKLPDIEKFGNCGSFFKNPYVEKSQLDALVKMYADVPYFEEKHYDKGFGRVYVKYKIPAGWLIEKCGYKGKRFGNCGVSRKHALIIVNYGDATGKEIYDLAQGIKLDVHSKFSIKIEEEVRIVK